MTVLPEPGCQALLQQVLYWHLAQGLADIVDLASKRNIAQRHQGQSRRLALRKTLPNSMRQRLDQGIFGSRLAQAQRHAVDESPCTALLLQALLQAVKPEFARR
ncbi:hypothetical protein [Pseudomonas sp. JV241A]|uniref:hypothetical protein n=1 Tax=Pseudomonas sp. JV241A TaxID=2078785 RepID=UPI001066A22A|nr:hypothetical protein [Pseudomonas sp. JV241A]